MFTVAVLSLSWGQEKSHHESLSEKEERNSDKVCRISQGFHYCEKCLQYQIPWAFPFTLYGQNEHFMLIFGWDVEGENSTLVQAETSCWLSMQVDSRDCFLITPYFPGLGSDWKNHMMVKILRAELSIISGKIFNLNESCIRLL